MGGRLWLPTVLACAPGVTVLTYASSNALATGLLPPCRKSPLLYALTVPEETSAGTEEVQELLAFGGKGWAWKEKGHHKKNPQFRKNVKMLGDTWLFDFGTQEWRQIDHSGPAARWKAGSTQVFHDRALALFGGCTETQTKYVQDDLWVFNATGLQAGGNWRRLWTEGPPKKRRGHVVVANSTHIVVVGGKTWAKGSNDRCLTDVWALPKDALLQDSNTPAKWTQGANFPDVCRWGSTGTLLNAPDGRLLLGMFGGRYLDPKSQQHTTAKGAYTYFDDLWLYDFAADSWSLAPTTGDKPRPRDHHGAASLGSDLYIYSGRVQESRSSHSVLQDVWSYSLGEGRWTLRSDGTGGPLARFMPGVAAVRWRNETVLAVFAGETLPGSTKITSMNDLWVFSPLTGKWAELSPNDCKRTPIPGHYQVTRTMVQQDAQREAIALGAGTVLVATIMVAARLASKTASARARSQERWLAVEGTVGQPGSDFHRL